MIHTHMTPEKRKSTWPRSFGRTFTYLRPHCRPLLLGMLFAVGVSIFYTFSITSVVPLLKTMFADNESLPVWITRMEAEWRLGISTNADLPDDSEGFEATDVDDDSPCRDRIRAGDRIVAIGGERYGSYELLARIAHSEEASIPDVTIVSAEDGQSSSMSLALRPRAAWQDPLDALVARLPAGTDVNSRMWMLTLVMLAVVTASLLGSACRFLNDSLVATAVQRSMHDLRTHLAARTLRLPLDWHSRNPPGDAIARLSNDIGKIETGLTTLFGKVIREPLKAAGVLAIAIRIDYRMLLVAVIVAPIGAYVIRKFGRGVKRAQKRASQSWGRLLDHLGERLAGIRVVKAYNMERDEIERFREEAGRLAKAQTHVEVIDAATKPVLETMAMFGVAAFVLFGGSLVFNEQIEGHWFILAVACMVGTLDPMRKMGNVNNRVQAADVAASRVFELIDIETEQPVAAKASPLAETQTAQLTPLRNRIRFEGVTFAYPANPDTPVLRDVDLTVKKGLMVALVGPNGSGKTTLMSLLLGFFRPQRGRIMIDDTDISTVSLESLRAQIGLVTQDAVIFSESVRFNIGYGANGATDEDITRAARMAHADDFIQNLRYIDNGTVLTGYDAIVSDRTLSGGQRQRIALARAILRDPPILVLDEATSQIDSDSERKIQEALEEITEGRTTFVIAHRFTTIARADMVVVLDQGRIVGAGRHDQLMTSCPQYVKLYETQFSPNV